MAIMQSLNTTQTVNKLVLAKRTGKHFLMFMLGIGFITLVNIIVVQAVPILANSSRETYLSKFGRMQPIQNDFVLFLLFFLTIVFVGILVLQTYRQFEFLIYGETWVFDLEGQSMEHNTKKVSFKQIENISVVEDCGHKQPEHIISIRVKDGKDIVIGNMVSDNDLSQLITVAQRISDFTGLRFVQVQKIDINRSILNR